MLPGQLDRCTPGQPDVGPVCSPGSRSPASSPGQPDVGLCPPWKSVKCTAPSESVMAFLSFCTTCDQGCPLFYNCMWHMGNRETRTTPTTHQKNCEHFSPGRGEAPKYGEHDEGATPARRAGTAATERGAHDAAPAEAGGNDGGVRSFDSQSCGTRPGHVVDTGHASGTRPPPFLPQNTSTHIVEATGAPSR
eukprot:gene14667-biopygen20119